MSNNIKISYNINCIINHVYWDIQSIIFKYNGIIFGGFVRDTIIRNYYCNLFWKKLKNSSIKDFQDVWNEKYDPETSPRTIVPNDIDICLYEEKDIENMMAEITSIIHQEFGMQNVNITKTLLTRENISYVERTPSNLHKYEYKITVGAVPYITKGTEINIMLDIVVPNNKYLMPPFNKLDFLCNGFIMTKPNMINLSSYTGTEIDRLNIVEKKEIEYKIIKDMVNFKTDYCLRFQTSSPLNNNNAISTYVKYTEQACNRIKKMISRNHLWTIGNMPILIEKHLDLQPKNAISCKNCCICCICCDNIYNKDKIVSVPVLDSNKNIIKGSEMHADCFFKYLNSQIENKLIEIDEEISYNQEQVFIRCPLRNYLDFNCKTLQDVIDKYIQS